MKKTKNNGITLISLVITIIIMLILVGVSITLAVNGGLFEYAGNAVGDTKNSMKNEQGLIDDIIDKYIVPNVPIEEKFSEIYNENTTITQGDYIATIPAGFAVGTSDGINKIKNGLVITDKVDENGNSIGNEFVWVPCTKDESELNKKAVKYAQVTKYNDGTVESKQYCYNDYTDWDDDGGNGDSVTKYGGFYVARYEAGIPSNAPFYSNADGAEYKYEDKEGNSVRNTADYVPVSKKNNPSWNGISQANAKAVSEKMYENSISVDSSLIDSYAWDTIVNWMESKEEYKAIATNSTNYGNYLDSTITLTDTLYAIFKYNYFGSWSVKTWPSTYVKKNLDVKARQIIKDENVNVDIYELATGSTESTKVLNIYDMAGNMWEWTTEYGFRGKGKDSTQYAVFRGGGFNDRGYSTPIAHRNGSGDANDTCSAINGFRVVLYLT